MKPSQASAELRRIASGIEKCSTSVRSDFVLKDLRRVLAAVQTPAVKVTEVELESLDSDGEAVFSIRGTMEFSGSYSQGFTGHGVPEWRPDPGPDPSEDPDNFYFMQKGIYESEVFKAAEKQAEADIRSRAVQDGKSQGKLTIPSFY